MTLDIVAGDGVMPEASSSGDGYPSPVHQAKVAIVLCADDYAFSSGVGVAIRSLIEAGRLSATSCMTCSPLWPAEAARLRPLAERLDVGLHFTLTHGAPLAPMPKLATKGKFPRLEKLIIRSLLGRIDEIEVADELERQIDRFEQHFGRPPDFVDGHEHVHQFPGIRDAVVAVVRRRLRAHGTWLRYPAMTLGEIALNPAAIPGATVITLLGRGFRDLANRAGIPGNTGFRGIRRFAGELPYAMLFDRFLSDIPCGALVMCHPGLTDIEPVATRHPATAREEEYAFLVGAELPEVLRSRGIRIARLRDILPDACKPAVTGGSQSDQRGSPLHAGRATGT